MKTVYIAGPYSGDEEQNTHQACELSRLALKQGFAPFVPHPSILMGAYGADEVEAERALGMQATLQILRIIAATGGELWVFGMSPGTRLELDEWRKIAGDQGVTFWTEDS